MSIMGDKLLQSATALHRKSDFSAAVTAYQFALNKKPNDIVILANLASALKQAGQCNVEQFTRNLESQYRDMWRVFSASK